MTQQTVASVAVRRWFQNNASLFGVMVLIVVVCVVGGLTTDRFSASATS